MSFCKVCHDKITMQCLKNIIKNIKIDSFEQDDIMFNIKYLLTFINNIEEIIPCDNCSNNNNNLDIIYRIVSVSLLFNWAISHRKNINFIKKNKNLYYAFKNKIEEFSINEILRKSILWKGEDYYFSYLVD